MSDRTARIVNGRIARKAGDEREGDHYRRQMAIFHVSKNTPTKAEVLAEWLPKQTWGPERGAEIERIGSFHFDDPEGEVGMETHIVEADGIIYQVPMTYRDAPLTGAEESFVATLEHSVLGTRWIYDALGDDQFLCVLAGVSLTGQGHALGMASFDGRWYAVPEEIRLSGGGWGLESVAVDGLARVDVGAEVASGDARVRFANDRFEMEYFRRPTAGDLPSIGLTGTWAGRGKPVVLTEIRPT